MKRENTWETLIDSERSFVNKIPLDINFYERFEWYKSNFW